MPDNIKKKKKKNQSGLQDRQTERHRQIYCAFWFAPRPLCDGWQACRSVLQDLESTEPLFGKNYIISHSTKY